MFWLLAACEVVPVQFTCTDDEPLCETLDILADERPQATGVDLTGFALYAPVEQKLVEDGEEVSDDTVTLVAGRDVLARVLVETPEDFERRTLTARVYAWQGIDLYAAWQLDMEVSGSSEWSNLSSSFNLPIDGRLFEGELGFSAEIVEAGADVSAGGELGDPSVAPVTVSFTDVGEVMKVVVVPIAYERDEGRLPDTSEEQLETYRQYMQWMYAVPEVELSLGKEISSDANVSASGSGWDQILMDLAESRTEQGVSEDTYLFGAFNPTADWGSFCGGGCVAGLSNMAMTAGDSFSRSSVGLGYTGADAALTMAHEVGHASGRSHSPGCGAAGADEAYPNDEGLLDARSYNPTTESLQETDTTYDIMSYCTPYGVAAFTYDALAQRIAEVNELYSGKKRQRQAQYRSLWIMSDGSARPGAVRTVVGEPGGERVELVAWGPGGRRLRLEGWFSPFSHVEGGTLLYPDPGFEPLRVEW